MRLIDLLKSDFNHYYFLCSVNDFEAFTEYEWQDSKGNGYAIRFDKHFVNKKGEITDLYDLGYCLCNGCGQKMSANAVAKLLDKSKLFEFDCLQHEEDTLYILLEKKR